MTRARKMEPQGKTKDKTATEPWGAIAFEGFEVDQTVSFNTWIPEPGEKRVFELLGWKELMGMSGKPYCIYTGKDANTGEEFSFVGGGMFDWTIRDKDIQTGQYLGVVYKGTAKAPVSKNNPQGLGQAKQWEIYLLRRPA